MFNVPEPSPKVLAIRMIRMHMQNCSLKAAIEFYDENPLNWERRMHAVVERDKKPSNEDLIRAAINEYYLALDERQNGNTAKYRAFAKIQAILGMTWVQGEQLAKKLT